MESAPWWSGRGRARTGGRPDGRRQHPSTSRPGRGGSKPSPGRDDRNPAPTLLSSLPGLSGFPAPNPALKCWAILGRPYGTAAKRTHRCEELNCAATRPAPVLQTVCVWTVRGKVTDARSASLPDRGRVGLPPGPLEYGHFRSVPNRAPRLPASCLRHEGLVPTASYRLVPPFARPLPRPSLRKQA